MFSTGIVTQFEAAHRLTGDFGPATRLHGHTYRVEITVSGPSLRDDGTLCDIGMLQAIVDQAVAPLHYQNLSELEAFAGTNTTAEQVALYLYRAIALGLQTEVLASLAVRVWESPLAFAGYEGDLSSSS